MLKVKLLNPLATVPTIAHPGEDLGYDIYALRVQGQPVNQDGTPVPYTPPKPGMPTPLNEGKQIRPIRVEAGKPVLIDTGIAVAFSSTDAAGDPAKYGLLIRDRSSMAKKGIFVTAGVVDAGYRGEVKVMVNIIGSGGYVDIWPGDKIAQLIPIPVLADGATQVEELDETAREEGGFGSSGQ